MSIPKIRRLDAFPLTDAPLVSIIVPARDEAERIAECIESLLVQNYPRFEVIAVDDRSADGTGAILESLAARDARLRVVRGEEPPAGWMGKAHAAYQGYLQAHGEWLLFTDADTRHAPFLLTGVMERVLESPASFATVLGSQRFPTLGAYLASLAVFVYLFLATDARKFSHPRSRQSLVNGQYLLFAREAYEAIGTHARVRGFTSTDVTLGYLAKLQGWLPLLLDGRDGLETTMYENFADAFRGWSRSLVNGTTSALGLAGGVAALIGALFALALLWVVPWLLAIGALVAGEAWRLLAALSALVGSFALLGSLGVGLAAAGRAFLWMPVSVSLFAAMAASGLAQLAIRGGTVWKGRVVRSAERLPPWRPAAPRPRRSSRAADLEGARERR